LISCLSGWKGSLFYILLSIFNALSLTLLAEEPALGMLIDDTPGVDEEIVEYDKVSNNGGEGEDEDYCGFYGFYWVGFCD